MPSTIGWDRWPRIGPVKLELVLVTVLCVAVFLGAAHVSESVFDRVPHTEDESAFLFQAQTIASGRIVAEAPQDPAFFSIPFIILRDGMWFGKYPLGFPLLLSAGVLAGHPWLVNATLAALCETLTWAVARRLFGRSTALLAAGLLGVSPFFLLQSGSMLSHVASLCWALLFLVLFSFARQQRGLGLSLAAGASMGMMFLTRPLSAVGIALPFVVWILLASLRQRKIARSYVLMACGALPFLCVYLGYNFYTTGSPFQTAYELWWEFDRLGFGPDVGINGHDLDDGIRNTKVNSNALASLLFGWPGRFSLVPAVVAIVVSLVTIIQRMYRRIRTNQPATPIGVVSPESWDLILASMILSLVAIHILYWTPGQMYGPRYYMEAVGPLVILTARGFMRMIDALTLGLANFAPGIRRPRVVSNAVLLAIILVLTVYAFTQTVPEEFDRFRDWNDINADGVAIVKEAELDNALVFVERSSWTDYAPFFAQNVPTLDSAVVYASDRGQESNRRLMELYPQRRYYRFGDGQLVPIEAANSPR